MKMITNRTLATKHLLEFYKLEKGLNRLSTSHYPDLIGIDSDFTSSSLKSPQTDKLTQLKRTIAEEETLSPTTIRTNHLIVSVYVFMLTLVH